MADGSCSALSRDDENLILAALHERWRLKREATQLSDTNLAVKFGVPRSEIRKLSKGSAWARGNPKFTVMPRGGTHCARIVEILREGPATAAEIAVSLGIGVRNAAAHLHRLESRSLVLARTFHDDRNPLHHAVKLYSLPEYPA